MRIYVGLKVYEQLGQDRTGQDRTGHFQIIRNSFDKM
jgi:hypothetical protein